MKYALLKLQNLKPNKNRRCIGTMCFFFCKTVKTCAITRYITFDRFTKKLLILNPLIDL